MIIGLYPTGVFGQEIRLISGGCEWKEGVLSDYRLADGIDVTAIPKRGAPNSPSDSMEIENEEAGPPVDDLWSPTELSELAEMLKLPLEYSEMVMAAFHNLDLRLQVWQLLSDLPISDEFMRKYEESIEEMDLSIKDHNLHHLYSLHHLAFVSHAKLAVSFDSF